MIEINILVKVVNIFENIYWLYGLNVKWYRWNNFFGI